MTSKLGERIKELREEHRFGVRELGRMVERMLATLIPFIPIS